MAKGPQHLTGCIKRPDGSYQVPTALARHQLPAAAQAVRDCYCVCCRKAIGERAFHLIGRRYYHADCLCHP